MYSTVWTSLVAQTVKCLPTMQKTWVPPLGREDLLEKEMATLSSILPWKMPWLEGPGGLQSTGSQSQLCLSGFTFAFIAVCLFILASSFTPPFPFGNHLFLYCSWQLLFGPFPI